jgi:hypothetical protein
MQKEDFAFLTFNNGQPHEGQRFRIVRDRHGFSAS